MKICLWIVPCAVLALVVTGGCGGPEVPSNLPELHPVAVTVTMDGEPLEGASVVFAPTAGTWGASGITDEDGVAQLRTKATYDGVATGEYRVAIKKMSDPPLHPELEGLEGDAFAMKAEELERRGEYKGPELITPQKWFSAGQSGVTATVPEGGDEFTFNLSE